MTGSKIVLCVAIVAALFAIALPAFADQEAEAQERQSEQEAEAQEQDDNQNLQSGQCTQSHVRRLSTWVPNVCVYVGDKSVTFVDDSCILRFRHQEWREYRCCFIYPICVTQKLYTANYCIGE